MRAPRPWPLAFALALYVAPAADGKITTPPLTPRGPGANYSVELTGTVLSSSYSNGPLAGAAPGQVAVLHYRVSGQGIDVVPGQLVNYAVDLASFDLDINGSTGLALSGPTELQVQNDFPAADGFRIQPTQLASGEFFESGFGTGGSFFPSADITQLVGTYDAASNLTSFGYTIRGGGGSLEIFPETLVIGLPPIGTLYCDPATPNSTGQAAELVANGSDAVANNDLTLRASHLPAGAFGYFLVSQTQDLVLNPNGSEGDLCLGGLIGRYVGPGQIQNSGAAGEIALTLNLTSTPQPNGPVVIAPGETWNFQGWHRDSNMGLAVSNFTNGLSVTFQ